MMIQKLKPKKQKKYRKKKGWQNHHRQQTKPKQSLNVRSG